MGNIDVHSFSSLDYVLIRHVSASIIRGMNCVEEHTDIFNKKQQATSILRDRS